MKYFAFTIPLIILLIFFFKKNTKTSIGKTKVVDNPGIRNDNQGAGHYGASRDGGAREHKGIDIKVRPGQTVHSPITGRITRTFLAYSNDNFKGVEIKEDVTGLVYKIFYVYGIASGAVQAGQAIAIADDVSRRYPGMTPHLHIEVLSNGVKIDPTPYIL